MSSYKIIDSTISVLFCARCANEDLEVIAPGRLVCRDCGMDVQLDPNLVRIGHLKGTKYKMRAKTKYSFRDIIDETRRDAFSDKYVPSPDPGQGRIGWREQDEPGAAQKAKDAMDEVEIRIAGVDDMGKGWRNKDAVDMIADIAADEEEGHDPGNDGSACEF